MEIKEIERVSEDFAEKISEELERDSRRFVRAFNEEERLKCRWS